ncbi:MAG: hypothetical protein KDD32_06890 [Bacteroidetes bacterium]|nr:hypothetical protein [Bacteroidota bacterium]
MSKMMRTLLATMAVFFTLTIVSCDDDEVTPTTQDTTVYPTPDDAFGILVAIKTFTSVTAGGFTTDVEFGTAVAAFIDGSNFLPAGTVTCNTEGLTQNDNNSYVYIPDFGSPSAATGITLGNEASWSVSGQGTVPAITETYTGFPSKPVITSATTINTASDYNFTWNAVTGADSLIVSIFGGSSNATKTVAGNATSVTFSSSDMSGVGTTEFGIIQVAAYKQKKEVISGENIYLTNESVGSETGVNIQ